jgi:hypothetical protein
MTISTFMAVTGPMYRTKILYRQYNISAEKIQITLVSHCKGRFISSLSKTPPYPQPVLFMCSRPGRKKELVLGL